MLLSYLQFVPTKANLTCQQNKSKSHVQESISDTTKAFYLPGNPSIKKWQRFPLDFGEFTSIVSLYE